MHSQRRSFAVQGLVALAVTACGSQLSDAPEAERAPLENAAVAAPTGEAEMPSPREAPQAAPTLTLSLTKHDQHVTLALQNRARGHVRFNSTVLLESADNTDAVQRHPLHLDEARPLPTCAELAPGALLELEVTPSPGAHRFVLTSCDGSARLESEQFALQAEAR